MKVLFILIDACRSTYITKENFPFIYDLISSGDYVKRVKPGPGFCERSEIFSGLECHKSGFFTAIGYLPEKSDYRRSWLPVSLASFLSIFSKKAAKKLFHYYTIFSCKKMKEYKIPYYSLRFFSLTEDGDASSLFGNSNLLFDLLKINNLSYSLDGFTSLSDTRKTKRKEIGEFVLNSIKNGLDFIPAYIGLIDSMGHLYCDNKELMTKYLNKVDKMISDWYLLAVENGYNVVFLGDHGMIPVCQRVNIFSCLKQSGLKLHKDYEMFLDSTFARFWFMKDCRDQIIEVLKTVSNYGKIVYPEEGLGFGLPLNLCGITGKPIYGELIWCAKPGVLISPDYFNDNTNIHGMHGYLDMSTEDAFGFFLSSGPNVSHRYRDEIKLSQVYYELCKLLLPNMPKH